MKALSVTTTIRRPNHARNQAYRVPFTTNEGPRTGLHLRQSDAGIFKRP